MTSRENDLYAVLLSLCAVANSLYAVLFSLCTDVKSLYAVLSSCRGFFRDTRSHNQGQRP